uniref:Putative PD-(D/E)XK nuclease superfamily protein n=2 Tax=viral metagenome TaxID=1070528 RepID=A0A6H1ZGQ2_9ZZZZ
MITHISYSSVLLFLNNPAAWYSKYVLGIRDQKTSPAALVGSAFHKYMEGRLNNMPLALARDRAVNFMNLVTDVDFGKTGSPEKCLEDLDKLILGYHENPIRVGIILGVEAGYTEKITGIKLPIKCYIDLIHRLDNEIIITDWKTVRTFKDEPTPAQILQGCFYYYIISKALKQEPVRFDIVQIKVSSNRDGTPQVKTISIVYADHPEYLVGVKELTKQSIRQMVSKRKKFLVNLRDDYEGEAEFKRFLEQFL